MALFAGYELAVRSPTRETASAPFPTHRKNGRRGITVTHRWSEWETRTITYMPGPTRRIVQYEGGVKSAYSSVLLRVMQCDPPHSPLSRFPHNTREVIRKLQRVDIHVSHVLHNTNQVSAMDNIFTFTGRIVGSSLMADVYSAQRAQARTGSHRARPVLGNK